MIASIAAFSFFSLREAAADTPDAFLEYVQTGSNQFIDTEVNAASGIKAEFNFRWLGYHGQGLNNMLGAQTPSNGFSAHLLEFGWIAYRYLGARQYIESGAATRTENLGNNRMTMDSDCVLTVSFSPDGAFETVVKGAGFTEATVTRNFGSSCNVGRNLYLFANNNDGTANEFANVRCYGVKIWQTNGVDGTYVLVRDFKPCRWHDRAALWDAVSRKVFFSGSGDDLTGGSVVTPTLGTHEVADVSSSEAQFIDTGVNAVSGTKAEMSFRWIDDSTNRRTLLGASNDGKRISFHTLGSGWMRILYGTHDTYFDGGHTDVFTIPDQMPSCEAWHGDAAKKQVFTVEFSPSGVMNVDISSEQYGEGRAVKDMSSEQGFVDIGRNLYIFANNNNNSMSEPAAIRLYGMKIWQTNGVDGTYVLVRDFKPVISDGRAGLMDVLDGTVYFSGSGTDLDAPAAVWNNTAGDNSFDNPANWSGGVLPQPGDAAIVNISGDTVMNVTNAYVFSKMSVTGNGTLSFTETTGFLCHMRLDIAEGVSVKRSGTASLADGGLSGKGGFILDPGAGATVTMTKNNLDFLGATTIAGGTVKFGDRRSFGPRYDDDNHGEYSRYCPTIRVKSGATLDENGLSNDGDYSTKTGKNKVVLEGGAVLTSNPGVTDSKGAPVTQLTLEGDALVDASHGLVAIGQFWNDWYSYINLGAHTLTVTGGAFFVSYCTISGTGTLDILDGATVRSTHDYDDVVVSTTCADGTIRIREGGTWHMENYRNKTTSLSVKNLILDGAVTRAVNTYGLTVTGTISGKGTTPVLTMADGAKFAPDGSGFLTVTESLSFQGSTVEVDISGVPPNTARIPLFKVGSAAMLPSAGIFRVSGEGSWCVKATEDGLGYELQRTGFCIYIR